MQHFHRVLLNTLIANVTSSFLWFALTFWIYLETRSVLATAIVGGSYMFLVAICSLWFGVVVDHNKKKRVMVMSSLVTMAAYVIAASLYLMFDTREIIDWRGVVFWLFVGAVLIGGVVENMRNIALSTTVTLLVPKEGRDKANGMVGMVQGVAFMVTSVFSGLSIGLLGMGWTLAIAVVMTGVALVHLVRFVTIPEKAIYHDPQLQSKKIDLSGSVRAIRAVPGLLALIIFTTFNNFVGGVFMALMDAYGLNLFTVEWWGVVLGVTSVGFILGGLIVAKKGLGVNPLRTLLLLNIGMAVLGMLFTAREWWWLYAAGIFVYMCLIPAAEAAEQTVIQRVVPLERQGRVFGFAQSVESASTPISAFIIGPIAQFGLIPYMNSAAGKQRFGGLLGAGQARGIALVFIVASSIMLAAVLLAFASRAYKRLSAYYQQA